MLYNIIQKYIIGKAFNKTKNDQCFDLANKYWNKLFGGQLKGQGAADIPNVNDFSGKATVYQNTTSFLAKPGDIVVWGRNFGQGYGHVGVVIEATLDYIVVIENNWLGGGWTSGPAQGGTGWEKATRRRHNYEFPMWFIRPEYKDEKKTANYSAKTKTKKPAAKKKKAKKLKYIKDNVKGYELPKRKKKKPDFIVLHNDAGSRGATATAYRNGLVNAPLSRLEAGIAASYIDKDTVWQALDEDQVNWHCANSYANERGYGIEICQSMGADNKTFLQNEQAAFQEAARLLKKWGLPANRNTIRLHCEFYSTSCPHRSAKLHTGFDPVTQGLLPKDKQLKLKDYFIKQIRQYMDGKIPTATVVKSTSASSNTVKPVASGWKHNNYGTYYKSENATYSNGNTPIITRTVGPFRSCPQAGLLPAGATIVYDTVCLQDYHVWVSYVTNKGYRVWLPIRTWNGVAPGNAGYAVGPLWGYIS